MKFFYWIFNILGFKTYNNEILLSQSDKDDDFLKVAEKDDKTSYIISMSQDKIKQIYELSKLTKDTIYHEKFIKVLEITQKIHDKIIADEKIHIAKLEQYHMYFTDEFLDTYNEALNDLRPKKEIDVMLKSNYKLQQEFTKEHIDKELQKINIHSLSIKERIDKLVSYINPEWKLIQEKEYNDVIEKDKSKGCVTTYGEKYTAYLISNWKLPSTVKFIGVLNDDKETPIIYDIYTLTVYKILYDSTMPEKLGDIRDETMKEIITKQLLV
jgi:hypothetical protein